MTPDTVSALKMYEKWLWQRLRPTAHWGAYLDALAGCGGPLRCRDQKGKGQTGRGGDAKGGEGKRREGNRGKEREGRDKKGRKAGGGAVLLRLGFFYKNALYKFTVIKEGLTPVAVCYCNTDRMCQCA